MYYYKLTHYDNTDYYENGNNSGSSILIHKIKYSEDEFKNMIREEFDNLATNDRNSYKISNGLIRHFGFTRLTSPPIDFQVGFDAYETVINFRD